jgi:hypothetical protein
MNPPYPQLSSTRIKIIDSAILGGSKQQARILIMVCVSRVEKDFILDSAILVNRPTTSTQTIAKGNSI